MSTQNLHTNIHGDIAPNSQKVETNQISVLMHGKINCYVYIIDIV
jgi:hypothetical protein